MYETKGNRAFSKLSLIVEGNTKNVSQFIMQLKSIYNKNFLNEQKVCLYT
jgi:hypothetical protein